MTSKLSFSIFPLFYSCLHKAILVYKKVFVLAGYYSDKKCGVIDVVEVVVTVETMLCVHQIGYFLSGIRLTMSENSKSYVHV